MSTTSTSTSAVVAVAEPMVTSQEQLALAGFLASRHPTPARCQSARVSSGVVRCPQAVAAL